MLAALSDFRVAHEEKFRFEYLVNSISLATHTVGDGDGVVADEETGGWEWRTAAMSYVSSSEKGSVLTLPCVASSMRWSILRMIWRSGQCCEPSSLAEV